jgi:integrase
MGVGGVAIAGDLSALGAVLSWAKHVRGLNVDDRLARNARATLKHFKLDATSQERDREPTDHELALLYAHWAASKLQRIPMETLCRFALASAMRLGEICGLMVEDVNREAHEVVIRDRKDPRNKIGNDQTVPLLDDAWAIVAPLIEGRTTGKIFMINAGSASVAFTRACAALEIKNLHFHDLRHRATASLFAQGLDIPRVALLTGHKTWAQLRRYTNIKPSDVRDTVKRAAALRAQADALIAEAKALEEGAKS